MYRALLFLVLAGTLLAEDPRVVILRGSLAGSSPHLQFLADETGLSSVTLAGVTGQELLGIQGQRLIEQAAMYRQAQIAAGRTTLEPLYVVLDPEGDWAHAVPWGSFTYDHGGRRIGPVTSPFLKLGEKMDHRGQSMEPTAGSAAANRAILARARTLFEDQVRPRLGRRPMPDFEKSVLDAWTLPVGGAPPRGFSQVAPDLTTDRFMSYLKQILGASLTSHGVDGARAFSEFEKDPELVRLVEEGNRSTLRTGIAETVAHEIGHVIHFAALGHQNFAGSPSVIYMDGMNHTMNTLSTPEFAFTEGWAMAHSRVVVGGPRDRTPGAANRIDYTTTADFVRRSLEQRAGSPRDQDLVDLEKAHRYLQELQARKGTKRGRYDFLRSEHAVGATLARLRQELGPQASAEVCTTLARHRSRDLAQLLEKFVQDHPQRKLQVYRILAEATEGILVTPAQVVAIEQDEAQGRATMIDIDQDGVVPGVSANEAHPALFPRDMPARGEEPLPGPRATGTATAAAPASSSEPILEPEVPGDGPDMAGLELR